MHAIEEIAGDDPAEAEPAGIEALYATAAEAQEGDEAEAVEQPNEDWLTVGPQAPEPIPDQRPRRCTSNRGVVVPDPVPAAKKVKKITSRGSKPDAVRRQSSRLAGAKTPPAKQSVVVEVNSSSQSGSTSS